MTERAGLPRLHIDARAAGTVLCLLGGALLLSPGLVSGTLRPDLAWPQATLGLALAIELIGLAFWCWARASADAANQLRRWTWLRRPAQALWLAAAAGLLVDSVPLTAAAAPWLPRLASLAVLWAGLELMAALPLARPYSDLSGPLLVVRPWLPALLPAAGFAVLWTTAPLWTSFEPVRRSAVALLLVTALLAALRAFGRRQWATSLRWLTVSESAMAAALVGTASVHPTVSLLLWLGACSGRAFMLAGELRGATPRRSATLSRLWRAAGWTASSVLAWPLLVALGSRLPGLGSALGFAAGGLALMLVTYVSVRRVIRAPERRSVMRPDAALSLSHVSALLTLALGPTGLAIAFFTGYQVEWAPGVLALAPALAGGVMALVGARSNITSRFELAGGLTRDTARRLFRLVTAFERRLVDTVRRAAQAALAPLRDLHTGDAQEYLLFLVGLSVLALVLPFLR